MKLMCWLVEEDKIEEDKGKEQEETPSGMHAKSRALGTVDFLAVQDSSIGDIVTH